MNVNDRLFAHMFKGLVYTQIWEDPEIDAEALALRPDSRIVAIASGGCNLLSYLIADPQSITAVDLSPAHVALARLKLAAARNLPDWETFHRFFAAADRRENISIYDTLLAGQLDPASRAWWNGRDLLGRRRISIFARNAYRYGVLGRFIGLAHAAAWVHGVRPRDVLQARTLEEQRHFFETVLAPLFQRPVLRWATASPLSLFGLGIPPAQYEALAGGRAMSGVLRERVERLACRYPLQENWFAWQAFGRRYPAEAEGPLPPYLRREHFEAIRRRADRVVVVNRGMTDHLASCSEDRYDRFVLLDAQDWMDDAALNDLWTQVNRVSRPGARVIFRTAAAPSLLPGRLRPDLLGSWRYADEASRDLGARDRSAIYGGFHLYIRKEQ